MKTETAMSVVGMCPIKGCEEPIYDSKYVMCRAHWMMVSEPLQKTIWRLYASGKRWDGYAEAVASATQQVEEKVSGDVLDPFTSWPFRSKERRR